MCSKRHDMSSVLSVSVLSLVGKRPYYSFEAAGLLLSYICTVVFYYTMAIILVRTMVLLGSIRIISMLIVHSIDHMIFAINPILNIVTA